MDGRPYTDDMRLESEMNEITRSIESNIFVRAVAE
jgi:hypothetical protein